MKKVFGTFLVACLMTLITFNVANAKSSSERELNKFIKESNVPNGELLSTEEKRNMYDSLLEGETIKFNHTIEIDYIRTPDGNLIEDTTRTLNTEGEVIDYKKSITPMGTIAADRITVSHDVYDSYLSSTGTTGKRIYANYRWHKTLYGGTKNDKIGIAVPTGWAITANSYECAEYQTGTNQSWDWHLKGNCNGGTYELDFYGAVWSLTRTDYVWHKGWVTLRMEKTSSSAQEKVLSQYVEDVGGSTSFAVSIAAFSLSITPDREHNKLAWDTPF